METWIMQEQEALFERLDREYEMSRLLNEEEYERERLLLASQKSKESAGSIVNKK